MVRNLKVIALLQARMSSTRLPGKVLKTILGKPMLLLQVERILRAKNIDKLILVTSTNSEDDTIVNVCKKANIACFRGSLDNVLDRMYRAAKECNPEHVVRLTADCPLADPGVIDAVISLHLQGAYDYTSNTQKRNFPDGLDVEIMKFSVLEQAWQEATFPEQKEHVTPFIRQQPGRFKLGNLEGNKDLSNLRWTVDTKEDFAFVSKVYEALYPNNPNFTTQDILNLSEENL